MADTKGGLEAEAAKWILRPEDLDREELERLGKMLDQQPACLQGRTLGMRLAAHPEHIRMALVSFEVRYGVRVMYQKDRRHLGRWVLDRGMKFYQI